jgi:hypothetical protein
MTQMGIDRESSPNGCGAKCFGLAESGRHPERVSGSTPRALRSTCLSVATRSIPRSVTPLTEIEDAYHESEEHKHHERRFYESLAVLAASVSGDNLLRCHL